MGGGDGETEEVRPRDRTPEGGRLSLQGHWETLASQKGGVAGGPQKSGQHPLLIWNKGQNRSRPPQVGPTDLGSGMLLTGPFSLPPPASPEGLQGSQEQPLVMCLKHGDFELAFVLLTKGADPRSISLTEGDTPLHAALHIFLDVEGRPLFCKQSFS